MMDAQKMMTEAGIKPTSNRLIVLKALLSAKAPLSLIELETILDTLERSSILRVLTLLHEHDVIHTLEDGRGITKYEICRGNHHCSIDDMHPHFYCEKCNKVFCFDSIATPIIEVPTSFKIRTVNYMLKGICPNCVSKP
ncbi:MAG: transcriptional repressor [Muribaculaceae bacterium]|nr:transcriptional repressor [Muribaculaceae bacterium]